MESQETSQDGSGTQATVAPSIAATLTSEAELKAWYLTTNPMLRRQGLSCPPTLFKEMQRDLRDYDSTVAIVSLNVDER